MDTIIHKKGYSVYQSAIHVHRSVGNWQQMHWVTHIMLYGHLQQGRVVIDVKQQSHLSRGLRQSHHPLQHHLQVQSGGSLPRHDQFGERFARAIRSPLSPSLPLAMLVPSELAKAGISWQVLLAYHSPLTSIG